MPRWSLEVGCVWWRRAVIINRARGGEQLFGLMMLARLIAVRILHLYARKLALHRHLEETRRLHVVARAVRVPQSGKTGTWCRSRDFAVGEVHAELDKLRGEEVTAALSAGALRGRAGALGRGAALGLDTRHGPWKHGEYESVTIG